MSETLTITRLVRKLNSHLKIRGDIPVGILSATGKPVPLVLRTDTPGVLAFSDSGEEVEIEVSLDADPAGQLQAVRSELKSSKARIISLEDEVKKWEARHERALGDLRTLQGSSDGSKARRAQDKQTIKKLEERIKVLERDLSLTQGDLDAERAARQIQEMEEAKADAESEP